MHWENDVWLLLENNAEQNCIGTRVRLASKSLCRLGGLVVEQWESFRHWDKHIVKIAGQGWCQNVSFWTDCDVVLQFAWCEKLIKYWLCKIAMKSKSVMLTRQKCYKVHFLQHCMRMNRKFLCLFTLEGDVSYCMCLITLVSSCSDPEMTNDASLWIQL